MRSKKPRPERDRTDESLRTERKKTDQALAERSVHLEETADLLVERAREQADAALDSARDAADRRLRTDGVGAEARATVVRERAIEDRALHDEREAADQQLRREREEHARILAKLLPLEREKTDRFLLTERARSDEALVHRDDFLGIVSHDLRNLLGGVLAHATLLAKQASASEEGQRTVAGVQRIERYVARMNRLIGDLVDVVGIDAGKLAICRESGDVAALLVEGVETFAQAAAEKGITLAVEAGSGPLVAAFDRGRLLQVLANLITNALKFTSRGGTILVHGERRGPDIRVSVRDDGVGIPGTLHEAVFQRFWQVGKHDQRGLGLGLYISRCIVDAHGGKIWVESEVGAGSTFHFTIPAVVAAS